ncbi:CRISPR-associated protein Cas5, partial [Leptospira kirschneri]
MNDSICLFVSVPVACFRAPYARTYAESLPVPAPSTVYGMLLSVIAK